MKIIEQTNRNVYRFACPECGARLEATGTEFEFLARGYLGCTCIGCGEEIEVKERKIEIVPMYRQIKQEDSKEKKKKEGD